MIRMAFMTDAARVIGATTPEANAERLRLLPSAIHGVMKDIYRAPNVVVGAASLGPWADATSTRVFVLTRDPDYVVSAEHIEVVHDHRALLDRFVGTDELLLVAGGRGLFQLFAPHADELVVAETDEPVPGDVVLRDWEQRFLLEQETGWEGGRTKHYRRRGRGLNHAISLYLDGIRDGNAAEAIAQHTGARYTQHSTGVPDGPEGFLAFFEPFLARNPERDIRVLRALEQGPYVFVHAYQSLNGGAAQWVTMDFFETDEDSRIIEHWDVIAEHAPVTPSGHSSVDGPTDVVDHPRTEANECVVRELIERCLVVDGDPTRVGDLVAPGLVQHGLEVADGVEAFRAFVANPDRSLVYQEIVLMVGEGNFVATLCKTTRAGDPHAQADLFRLEAGRVVEHWEAAEPALPSSVNAGKF